TGDTNNNTNPGAYGTTGGATGHVYNININGAAPVLGAVVVVEGGASSVINSGLGVYSGSSDQQSRLATDVTAGGGTSVDTATAIGLKRKLWLRSQ
ncbi:MAG TPA: hypothetical protein VF403_05330, partial [Kofleriaceae bacterium]